MTPKQARLRDVADAAGVTPSTASRALHRPEMVNPATRARVETAARELGYRPNTAAQRLIAGRARILALVVPDLTNPYFAFIAREAEHRAQARDHDVYIVDTAMDGAFEVVVIDALSYWVDGVIACSAQRNHPGAARRVPIVYMNRRVRGSHAVLLDQAFIVDAQLGHLSELGHERVLWVDGPKDYWASGARRRRALRWSTRLDVAVTGSGPADFQSGLQIAADLDCTVTAVAAFNDAQAFGIVHGLLDRGVRIPHDVSVIGSDDVPSTEYVRPRLTTVRAPRDAMSAAAVSLLIDHATDGDPVIVETLTGELVVRGSTAPPSGGEG